MTKDQFNRAVELLQHTNPFEWTGTEAEQDRLGRVVVAAACVIKHRLGIPGDAEWTMLPGALEEFLASLTPDQFRKLKRTAEGIQSWGRMAIH